MAVRGRACFCAALVGIALVTAAISDLANLVGCVLELEPQVTAITIVQPASIQHLIHKLTHPLPPLPATLGSMLLVKEEQQE
eukprot:4088520-Amphidinium_carterae.1